MGDYTQAGIQKQRDEAADNMKRFAKDGDYGKVSATEAARASVGPPNGKAALESGVTDYIQRNPNKTSATVRTGNFNPTDWDSIVRTTMSHNPRTGKDRK